MIRFILFILLLQEPGFLASVKAQAKNDYIWILGHPPNKPEKYFGGVMLDFKQDLIHPEYFDINFDATRPGVLSNKNGELLAYSDGCRIYNSHHNIMVDGDSINFGEIWLNYCDYGYPGTQNHLLLPWPGDSSKAILFHVKIDDNLTTNYLLYSIIEINNLYPLGHVIEKNKFLINPGSQALITAVRHANGRDWWLLMGEYNTNRFFKVLIDPTGVKVDDVQSIGNAWGLHQGASQVVFTPDGTKYIRFYPWKGIDIFDFDRCTGQLTNNIESGLLSDPIQVGGGVAISPDSRYLYVSNNIKLYQFDLLADDILASKILIDTFDGYQNPFATTFYQMMLAPDGKIYMFATNGVKSLHVINHPERPGKACDFVQHGIELPAYISIGSINLPYFRLGPEDGGSCDTLGINNLPIADFRYEIDTLDPLLVHFRNLSYFEPETFSWSFGNNTTSTFKHPGSVEYGDYGAFEVCLTVANEYGNNTFCRTVHLNDSISAVHPEMKNNLFKINPNPFHTNISISLPDHISNPDFVLYEIFGTPVYQYRLLKKDNVISLPDLPDGLYFYTIRQKGDILQSGKLIKTE